MLTLPRGKHIYMRVVSRAQSRFSLLTFAVIAPFLYASAYLRVDPNCQSNNKQQFKRLIRFMHMPLSACSWFLLCELESSTFTSATEMATRRVLTVDEVVEELENSDSEGENDESEDDFDGYLEESEWWSQREMEDNGDDEVNGSEEDQDNSMEEMEDDVPSIPPYTLTSGCSATLSGNRPIDYFSLFVDEEMLQHIVDQTILYSKQFIDSHTLAPHSRIRQWLKETHTTAELRRFLALILTMGIVRYPQIESHWSTSWPYATDAFSSVSYFHYQHVYGIETLVFFVGYETRSILPTDEIFPPE